MKTRYCLFVVSFFVALLIVIGSACNSSKNSVGPQEPKISPYTGVWEGTNSQNRAIYFQVTEDGIVDTLSIRLKMSFVTFSVTTNFIPDTTCQVKSDTFCIVAELPPIISNIYTTIHATFDSDTSASGKYDKFYGSFYIITSSYASFGTGTALSAGTWKAHKVHGARIIKPYISNEMEFNPGEEFIPLQKER